MIGIDETTQMKRRFLLRATWLGVLLCLLFSCKPKTQASRESLVFRYNEAANLQTLDPAFAKDLRTVWATNQLFNGLVQLDDSLKVVPDIAKTWQLSEDGKTYTFCLRNDVFFHRHPLFGSEQTRRVVARDFTYSFDRLQDPELAAPGKWILEHVKGYAAINDSTFVIELRQAFPPFLSLMSMKYCSVVPEEAVVYFGSEFRAHPIGTGPFQFQLWVENTKLVFRKNQQYHERDFRGNRLPYLEAIAISFLPDKQSEFLQFIQGNLDFLNSIDASYKDEILTQNGRLAAAYQDRIDMQSGPYLNTEYLGFFLDAQDGAANALKIRQALNCGFDREKMIAYLRNGIGRPAVHGFVPKGMPSFREGEGQGYQPQRAKQLIAAYREETGDLTPTVTISTNPQYLDLCEYIQRELQKSGLNVLIDVLPPSTLRQAKAQGKLSVFRGSWVADYPDAENYFFIFHSKNFSPKGPNYTHFKNSEFDRLYEAAIKAKDRKIRERKYRKMNRLLMDSVPVIPLYYDEVVHFTQKNTKGLGINPINQLHLKWVRKTSPVAD